MLCNAAPLGDVCIVDVVSERTDRSLTAGELVLEIRADYVSPGTTGGTPSGSSALVCGRDGVLTYDHVVEDDVLVLDFAERVDAETARSAFVADPTTCTEALPSVTSCGEEGGCAQTRGLPLLALLSLLGMVRRRRA